MNLSHNQRPTRPPSETGSKGELARVLCWFGRGGVLILIGWSLGSFGLQFRGAMRASPNAWSPVFAWRATTPRVEDVRAFAERVGARVPEGESILLTLGGGGDDEFFLSMWVASSLPRHTVLRRENVAPGAPGPDYRLDFPSWPPDAEPSVSAPSGLREPRLLIEGLGALWYAPSSEPSKGTP